jgi:membrane-associated phospholipid phosphatase
VLLAFWNVLVVLLFLVAVAVKFRRHARISEELSIVLVMAVAALVIPSRTAAQIAKPDQNSLAHFPVNEPPETVRPLAPSPSGDFGRAVSWKLLPSNVIADQKQIWSFPARLLQGKNRTPTAAVLAVTAGLVLLDPTEARYFRRTPTFHGFNNIFNGTATAISMGATPASLYVMGLVRKDSKLQHTALLAGEAMADAELLTTVLKDATRRVKPAGFPASGNFNDSWFEMRGSPSYFYLKGDGSFPSGHTIAAFSVATIIARRYRTHRWVPYAAYGLASVVGFSRLTLSVHFLSDVFMGGALGYSVSRFTVLRE